VGDIVVVNAGDVLFDGMLRTGKPLQSTFLKKKLLA
jgi:hypothetical protein